MAKLLPQYRISPKATDDLEAIWLFSLQTWGLKQTETYIDAITSTFDFLAANPKIGPSCDHIRTGYRRHPIRRHMIYYRLTPDGIDIMRILHDRMQAKHQL
jgi:toxin ParE1/3/4